MASGEIDGNDLSLCAMLPQGVTAFLAEVANLLMVGESPMHIFFSSLFCVDALGTCSVGHDGVCMSSAHVQQCTMVCVRALNKFARARWCG